MRSLAICSLVLVFVLILLAAYLRLDHSGIGCEPWPDCYAYVGVEREQAGLADRLIEDTTNANSWVTPTHRVVATLLGLLVLGLTVLALQQRRHRVVTSTLLLLTVFLAIVGAMSSGLTRPAVVVGNLVGGFAMLGLLAWLVFRRTGVPIDHGGFHRLIVAAIFVLAMQVFIGALTSANFAAAACLTFPDCQGSWLPGKDLATAADLGRQYEISDYGIIRGGPERADIHKLHRLSAVATLLMIIGASTAAMLRRRDLRTIAAVLIALVVAEFAIGVGAILVDLPISLAVAHNGLAALLLAGLLKLYCDAQRGRA